MKLVSKLAVAAAGLIILVASFRMAGMQELPDEKQLRLLQEGQSLIVDEAYVSAIPVLEEALTIRGPYTKDVEEALKGIYRSRLNKSTYHRRYSEILEGQVAREDATADIYLELAQYYMSYHEETEAFELLQEGIDRFDSDALRDYYDANRYQYEVDYRTFDYDDVTELYSGAIQVRKGDLWGVANPDSIVLPIEYDQVSAAHYGRVLVWKDGKASVVQAWDQERTALLHPESVAWAGEVIGIGNYTGDRLTIQTTGGWLVGVGALNTLQKVYEDVGSFSNERAAAKQGGKWGLIELEAGEWTVEPKYARICLDRLGRCYFRNAFFGVLDNGDVKLVVDGQELSDTYEDARPFSDGYAAVKKNGKWGFIDIDGTLRIDYQYEDAWSFSCGLAAVQVDGLWGYVNGKGEMVIDNTYIDARMFENYMAPVRSEDGWQFITLKH